MSVLENLKQKLLLLKDGNNNKNLMMLGGGAVFITALIMLFLLRSNQDYVALFGSQEQLPVAQVVEVLGGESIKYRVDPNSGQILVSEGSLLKARMALAAKGITATLPSGYELMDKESVLGSSQFIQNVRYKRSLEGELAQSIMALDSVAHARVHLGISESSSFVINNKPQSSASVIVRLNYGQQLKEEQIGAIIHLVAGSVPGMKTELVQVVDQQGRLLSDSYQANSLGYNSQKNSTDVANRLQSEIEKNVSHILLSLVGTNNYRVSVMPQLDLSRVEETQERYSGDPRINNENIHQENITDELALGIPGSLSNRPANQPADAENNNPSALSTRNQAQRSYSYDRDIRHIRHPSYKVEKMTVAIILNKESPALQEWGDEQMALLKRLVEDAAGIDAQRGDSLSLNMMSFTPPTEYEEMKLPWWQEPTIMRWVEIGGIGLLSLLFLLFAVRPVIKRLTENVSVKETVVEGLVNKQPEEEDSELVDAKALELPRSAFSGDDNLPPQSSGLETKVEYLQLLAQNETERVAEVIKQWINSNDRSSSKQD